MTTDIRAHLTHRLSIALTVSVYCRDCDLYMTELHTVAMETDNKGVTILVLTPSHQEGTN
jgi:hypothetical protein